MKFAASIRASSPSSCSSQLFRVCSSRLSRKQKRLASPIPNGSGHFTLTISSVLGDRKARTNDNGATEPTRILLERLFAQTQKLEEQMNQESRLTEDLQLGFNLENLESDLHAALAALKNKEEDLQDAERMVLLEHAELERAKEDLERREKEIAAVAYKHEQLEDALRNANLNLASKTREIEDLKLHIKERDQHIAAAQSALDFKQQELDGMRSELVAKSDELAGLNFELASKAQLLNEANKVITKQDLEIQDLRKMVEEKQKQLEVSLELHTRDEEKLELAETNLKKRTMEYFVVHEELKKLAEITSRNMEETNKSLEEFGKVKKLLADVRSELVASQRSLSSSREKMKSQELLLESHLAELEDQKLSIVSYIRSLRDAHLEVESEQVKLRVAEARNRELEDELSVKKQVVEELQVELKNEKFNLQQALREKSILEEELDRKSKQLDEVLNSLQLKESELAEAKVEIQHLQSKQSSLNLILNEKDAELISASKRLEELNKEVLKLKMLVSSKEEQLVQASGMLKEKDAHLQVMQHELSDSKLKYADAENVVQRIVDLTNELVASTKDEDCGGVLSRYEDFTETTSSEIVCERKQLEAEITTTRENLRTKEMEVLASQRALAMKDEELNLIREQLDAREKELRTAKLEIAQEAEELRRLHALAQERIGEKSIGDLALETLQLEAAQLEVQAATTALSKLAELSRELLNRSSWIPESENDLKPAYNMVNDGSHFANSSCDEVDNSADLTCVKTEVVRLMALTEELMREAGIGGCTT